MASITESQLASSILMIRPVRFESNPLTAESNRFQNSPAESADDQQQAASSEFEALLGQLLENRVRVVAIDDTPEPHTPDSIFPNNWVSFHADGTVVLYPMEAANRRTERRRDIVEMLNSEFGYRVENIVDLTHHERHGHYLEGTGSMVLDRANHIAYACLSSRTHLDVLGEFAQRLDYEIVAFDAVDRNGAAIYHTNVLMNIGEDLVVVCTEALPRDEQRNAVMESLRNTGREILPLDFSQLEHFAGNMLELKSEDGHRLITMSARALGSLTDEQVSRIESSARIVSAPLDSIENSAGGSVRCMLAEIHLTASGVD